MKVTRLFTNSDGLSQLEEIEIALERNAFESVAKLREPKAMLINETKAGHQYPWHNAPQKQWVVTLQGEIQIELRDGGTRKFGPGSVILAEDLTGSGHRTCVISSEDWRCVYLPFDGDICI